MFGVFVVDLRGNLCLCVRYYELVMIFVLLGLVLCFMCIFIVLRNVAA